MELHSSDYLWNEESKIRARYSKRTREHLYSCFDEGHLFFLQQRERRVLEALKREGFANLETAKIFEVGCGSGGWIRDFIKWGAKPENIEAVELLNDRVDLAKRLCPSGVRIRQGNGARLDDSDKTYDIVLQSTVFTSILDSRTKEALAAELMRILKDDGIMLWYDFHVNNPRNADVNGIKKKEIQQLFPDCAIQLNRITLAPPLYRVVAPRLWTLCSALEWLKVCNTHYLGVIRKKR